MTHDKNCPDCHGKGWYKHESAPVNVDCKCVDKPQAALDALRGHVHLAVGDVSFRFISEHLGTIRTALTEAAELKAQNEELLGVLKLCLPRIEEIRLVDLGAVRDAEMQDYQERKVMARRELAETNELINKINSAIARAEKGTSHD